MKTKDEQIQWTIDKWALKADMGESALIGGLNELWDVIVNQQTEALLKENEELKEILKSIRLDRDSNLSEKAKALLNKAT